MAQEIHRGGDAVKEERVGIAVGWVLNVTPTSPVQGRGRESPLAFPHTTLPTCPVLP